MSSILEQLEVKPVPKSKERVKIVIPIEGKVKMKTKPLAKKAERWRIQD